MLLTNGEAFAQETLLLLELIEFPTQALQLNSIQFYLSGNLIQENCVIAHSYALQRKSGSSKNHNPHEQNG